MKYRKFLAALLLSGLALSAVGMSGCGNESTGPKTPTVKVSVFKPFKSDTPVMREYTGTVTALQEVPIRAKVSGTVVEKYIHGGEKVTEGQPLYRIDTRSYEALVASAQANAAQAQATYENARRDLARYEELIGSGAISQQAYDSQKASVASYKAVWDASLAQEKIARDNLQDTVVTAPFSGTLSMDDVNIGAFVTAGNTPLVTISSSDPLYVQFDLSEAEYLALAKDKGGTDALGSALKLRLSDGTVYEKTGNIVQVNSGLQGGQISIKASYPNPDNMLIPGMYATVVSDSEVSKDSLLVPTKALIQLLNRNMIDVVKDGKVEQKAVDVAGTYGIYSIIASGVDLGDEVIVEGQGKVRGGQEVTQEEITREQLEQSVAEAFENQTSKTKA